MHSYKPQFHLEPYLIHIKNRKHRSNLCQFRTSSHKLRVEKGRHHNLKLADRICLNCTCNSIEDEMHFLLDCPLYQNERLILLQNLFEKYPHLKTLQRNMLFIWIMSAEDNNICSETAKYVFSCFNKRRCEDVV